MPARGVVYAAGMLIHRVVEAARYIRVPSFQRPYVWGAEHRRMLADSIVNGIPIGQVLLWSIEQWGDQLVLDGQQRLTSLARMADPLEPDPGYRLDIDLAPLPATIPFCVAASADSALLHEWMDDKDKETAQAGCVVRDAVRSTEVRILSIVGPESFARDVYERINSAGVVASMPPGPMVFGPCPTIDERIHEMRAACRR